MTDGQIKALFTMLEYIAKMVVEKNERQVKTLNRQIAAYRRFNTQTQKKALDSIHEELSQLRSALAMSHRLILTLLPDDQRHEMEAILRDYKFNKNSPR